MLEPRPEIRTATPFLTMRSPVKIQPPVIGDSGARIRPHGPAQQWLDQRHRLLAENEVNASLGIGEACLCPPAPFVSTRASVPRNPRVGHGFSAARLLHRSPYTRRD